MRIITGIKMRNKMQTTKGFKSPIVNGDKNMINTNVKTCNNASMY